MKKYIVVLAVILAAFIVVPVFAQQPMTPDAQKSAPPAGGMMPMMHMCPMMGGMMTMPMGQQAMDPKMMSQMMEMHGEMMKAMGDIMMKYAKRTPPAR